MVYLIEKSLLKKQKKKQTVIKLIDMKEIKRISLIVILTVIVGFSIVSQISQEKELIIGTWISVEDPEWKWVFTKEGKCFDYYNNELSVVYNYSIETTSPQCEQEVSVGELFSYLVLINTKDTNDKSCYEIFSLDEKTLQIRYFNTSSFIYMNKQNQETPNQVTVIHIEVEGLFQLTGKYNYQEFTTFYQKNYDNTKDFVLNPELIASNKELSVLSALWFYKKKVLDKITVDDDTSVEKVTYKINGGQQGLSHRKKLTEKAKKEIECD